MIFLGLLLKISVPPVLVALMSLAARRWGATFGGLIMGLPWMTGPLLFFLGVDKGTDFLVSAATGAVLAVWGMAGFIVCFGYAAGRTRWGSALAAAVVGYVIIGSLTQGLLLPIWVDAAVASLSLCAANILLPKPRTEAGLGRLPSWDIPARMMATFALVSLIIVSADLIGPQRSGLIASYPVILTVIGTFTLRQWGRDALLRLLHGISLSLLAFVGFFTVVGSASPVFGISGSFVLATLVALAISAVLLVATGRPQQAIQIASD